MNTEDFRPEKEIKIFSPPQRYRWPPAPGVALAWQHHFFNQTRFQQFRSDRGHRSRTNPQILGKLNPWHQPSRTDSLKNLLAQGP